MSEDDFEPRLGRMRSARSPRGRKYLGSVLAAALRAGLPDKQGGRRFGGSRIGRGAVGGRVLGARDPHLGLRARRAIVKTRLVRLGTRGIGAARAHLRYIQRDGVGRDGGVGELYSASEDAADGRAFLERCDGDRHQFRLIVSAEDGAEYDDLRPLIRRLVARMEEDLGTGLDWVAADHADTLHPHTHVILRGRDDRGGNLVIAPEYIAHGMRERVSELVALDLGPRTDREIEARLRLDVEAERLTALDRRLLRASDGERTVVGGTGSLFDRALHAGRLRKLAALGLAEELGSDRWRLADGMEDTLRALGERNDIVRTLQRALSAARLDRAAGEQRVFDPLSDGEIAGRVVARGLADEHRDRHYLIVDAIDGRTHYVALGGAEAVEPLPEGAIVRVMRRGSGLRASDRTIAAIAAAHDGHYSAALHRASEPRVSPAFVEAHVRRLEGLRRALSLERDGEGVWRIAEDHLAQVARHSERDLRERPVSVEILSPVPLENLPEHDGATWLDEVLAEAGADTAREAGFGRELRAALAARRAWLLQQGLATEQHGEFVLGQDAAATLRRRELLRVAQAIASDTGKAFNEPSERARIEGVVRRRLELASGRFAVIESAREFVLVPWRPTLGRAMGKPVAGIMRGSGTSWTIGRSRSLER